MIKHLINKIERTYSLKDERHQLHDGSAKNIGPVRASVTKYPTTSICYRSQKSITIPRSRIL